MSERGGGLVHAVSRAAGAQHRQAPCKHRRLANQPHRSGAGLGRGGEETAADDEHDDWQRAALAWHVRGSWCGLLAEEHPMRWLDAMAESRVPRAGKTT